MMTGMRRSIVFALALAVPIELLNFFVFPYPIDVGLPDDASWLQRLVGAQWIVLHWPGLRLLEWLGAVGGQRLAIPGLFASGYIDTVMVILASALFVMWLRRLASKHGMATGPAESPDLRD